MALQSPCDFIPVVTQCAQSLTNPDTLLQTAFSFKIRYHEDLMSFTFISDSDPIPNPSAILSDTQLNDLWKMCPPRYQIKEPRRLFTSESDGFSLKTMYRNVEDFLPILIVIKSGEANIFGAFIADPVRIRPGKFYGSGETFLFTVAPTVAQYKWRKTDTNK
eukprot:TRINITY_DN4198_c0_g1_i5.p1 TRINITY_DN4198_c0_g1~~TRINITY_DN4198_c0_g1_i5.p1  ORF type:complete len:162 (-),score=18.21 TRINITY_DN4198_c0_g1_i5:279-764(-)